MNLDLLSDIIHTHYEVHEWKHSCAILKQDFPAEWNDICEVLTDFRLRRSWITVGGGRKSKVAESLDSALGQRGWIEKGFDTKVVVDQQSLDSPTHKVDCFKNWVALEIEWNNKDPFFDRDLNNFRLLFELRVVSVGVIITRCDELQDIFDDLGRGSSYGSSTTHMSKLLPKIQGGSGGGCPLIVFGIKNPCLWRIDSCKQRLKTSKIRYKASLAPSWPTRRGSSRTELERWRQNTSVCRVIQP